jgi:hypothetical protein
LIIFFFATSSFAREKQSGFLFPYRARAADPDVLGHDLASLRVKIEKGEGGGGRLVEERERGRKKKG